MYLKYENIDQHSDPNDYSISVKISYFANRLAMIFDFTMEQIAMICLLFVWTGFVRTGLGFGGAALGLPLMLFVKPDLLLWLPMISTHLLFFSGLTLRKRLNNVDWAYFFRSLWFILPPVFIGIFGLVNLPPLLLNLFIYAVTLFYGLIWMLNFAIKSQQKWTDKLLLIVGGYVAGMSLTGAPLIVAVYMRNVSRDQLRNTLFVLWFTLVTIKMTTFVVLSVELHFIEALCLIPVAAIGHVFGLRAHESIIRNDQLFKQWVGVGLVIISLLGLFNLYQINCLKEDGKAHICSTIMALDDQLLLLFNPFMQLLKSLIMSSANLL